MENLNALKSQVEDLKERLGTNEAKHDSEASEFKALLATIKTNLQAKQTEIERLSAENEQLRSMLDDALAAVRSHQAQGPQNVLRDLHAEMAALVQPIGNEAPHAIPAEPAAPCKPKQKAEAKAEAPAEAKAATPAEANEEEPDAAEETDAEVDDSPALRRIMHRRGGKAASA